MLVRNILRSSIKLPRYCGAYNHLNNGIVFKSYSSVINNKVSEESIRETIKNTKQTNKPEMLVEAIELARQNNITLDPSDYLSGIRAYANFPKGQITIEMSIMAIEHYKILKSKNKITHDLISDMLKISKSHKKTTVINDLIDDFQSTGFKKTPKLTMDIIECFMECGLPINCTKYFAEYRANVQSSGWEPLNEKVYLNIAILLATQNETIKAIQMLQNMKKDLQPHNTNNTGNNTDNIDEFVLSPASYNDIMVLLSICIINYEIPMLLELLPLIINSQYDIGEGTLSKLYELSVGLTRPDILSLCIKLTNLRNRNFYVSELMHIVIMQCRTGEIEHIIESIIFAQTYNYFTYDNQFYEQNQLCSIYQHPDFDASYIQECIGKILRSANDIDKLYFALVDMSDKTQIQVPSIILNAMIDGTGKLNLLDRGFATLQEYEPVFKVTPDIESYNSLLHATAKSRSPKVTVLLSLLQQMEENNITPNNISYSILIECMIDNNDMNGISDIMNYMVEQNIVPTLRALRRLVIYYEKNEMNEKSIEIINLYKKTTNKILPKFFLDRIKNIQEEKTKEKQKDGDDVKEKSMLFNRISFGSKK